MKIYSSENSYLPIIKMKSGEGYESYIARNKIREQCLVIEIFNNELILALTPLFLDFAERAEFVDFAESFPFEGRFYIVFKNKAMKREKPLGEWQKELPHEQRLWAARSMLGIFMAQLTPYPIMCDILLSGNVYCSPSGEVRLFYDLSLKSSYGQIGRDKAMLALAEVLSSLFGGYENEKLAMFLDKLANREFESMEEVYRAFSAVSEQLEAPQLHGEEVSLKVKIERASAAASVVLPPVLKAAAAVLALALLLYTLYVTVISPPPVDNGIKQIGTVVVDEGLY